MDGHCGSAAHSDLHAMAESPALALPDRPRNRIRTDYGARNSLGTEWNLLASGTDRVVSPIFLVNNLLLLNQFPDIEADRMAQRNHLPIAYGTTFSSYIYGLFSLDSLTIVLLGVQLQTIPTLSYLAIIPLVATAFVVYSALKFADDIPRLLPSMGLNVVATLTTPLLLGLGILLG